MQFERIDSSIEYLDNLTTDSLTVEVEETRHSIEPGDLLALEELDHHHAAVSPDAISSALGLPVDEFDESPVYRGSETGLELTYAVLGTEPEERLAIISFGEVQYGRYAYKLEAVVYPDRPSSD